MLTYENSIIVEPFRIVSIISGIFREAHLTTTVFFFSLADSTYKHVYYILYNITCACVV